MFVRGFIALTASAAISLFVCTHLFAQARVNSSGTGGVNTIQGQIFTSNGRVIDSPITVRLRSVSYGELTLVTDQNGGFAFKYLAPGSYEVSVVAGDEYEPSHEYVVIDPDIRGIANPLPPSPRIFTVPIYLQPKRTDNQKTGVLDARLANVPEDAVKHYKKAAELAASGKNHEAIAELQKAIHAYPAFTIAQVELGALYLRSGQVDLSIETLAAVLSQEERNFDASVTYGIALLAKGRSEEAEKALLHSAELNSAAITPHYYLGMLYVQKKDLDPAQTELEAAEKLGGGKAFPLLHRMLGGIYVFKKMNALAVKELEAYLTLDPKTKDADRLRMTIANLKSQPD